jgi:hypothetical protein
MSKQLVKIVDRQFSHGKSFGTGDLQISPANFDWYRGLENINDFVVFSENSFSLVDNYSEKIKVGFIIESPLINPSIYDYIKNPFNYNKFDFIFTFSHDLIKVNPDKFKYYPFGGCWIYPEERLVHQKTKNISIVASIKKTTLGHQLRHAIVDNFKPQIEGLYGGGYQFVQNKIEALKDYRYSFVVEQGNHDAMFSEKVIDCFMTGTIPIYWGCEGAIGQYFNPDGILQFNKLGDLPKLLESCTEEFYTKNLSAIKENFEIAKQYCIPEDYMWNHYFKNLLNK